MRFVSLLVLGLFAVPLLAGAPRERQEGRERWEWTVEERIAARFDPVRAAERPAVISGQEHPELFLPGELFNTLLGGLESDAEFRATSRAILRDGIREFGFDDQAFWRDLESAIASHVRLASRHAALRNRIDASEEGVTAELAAEMNRLGPDLCRSRAAALVAARRQFGAETFDRFLYTVVAPVLTITPDARTGTAEHVLFLEGGCQ